MDENEWYTASIYEKIEIIKSALQYADEEEKIILLNALGNLKRTYSAMQVELWKEVGRWIKEGNIS